MPTAKTPPSPAEVYRAIREANPGEPFGEHWEGFGAMLGEGVWADPEYVGVPGEHEFAHQSWSRPAARPGRRARPRGYIRRPRHS